ncbi:MupG family TIM beta-alpha barrel fold protein [Anaerococcus tetradius]|uniref:MupG family TIM beta-alpha barrel fold protein n=1 Tax=Anaerococcus tetradius TaxID=33036 RepID=UPI0023F1F988|nr:MupG family TIM beta-alpha barrel fold protein [Anaerococcus tetradius]
MRKLGISIYPEHSTEEKDYEYIKLASRNGFSRIFTCLLSVKDTKDNTIKNFKSFILKAHELGFKVSVDTNREVFEFFGATASDISVFARMGVDIIRLDWAMSDYENIILTNNPYSILIEFNASSDISLDLLIKNGANRTNMSTCHNFYPQEYTGLSKRRFDYFTDKYYKQALPVHGFISSNNENTFGPWPVYKGLCTLEEHRGKDIGYQLRYMIANRKINDIIIGNAYASEEELEKLGKIDLSIPSLEVDENYDIIKVEKEIMYNFTHSDRIDSSEYFIRSSVTRSYGNDKDIPYRNCKKEYFEKGDILIVNNNLSHYRGEVEIVKKKIKNTGERNLVGRLNFDEQVIMDMISEKNPFKLIKGEKNE